MIERLLTLVMRERILVIALALVLVVAGSRAFQNLNIEAYPDPSAPTIEIISQNAGWSAEEMERQITIPLEIGLNGMPGLEHIRSVSLLGLSDIKCYFSYETDYNFARQEVLNRLQMVNLPGGVQPQLSPTSAIGEIYRYRLVSDHHSLMELKETQDWVLERQFKQIPGIIDVVSFGGPTKEYHVELDPELLISYGVTIGQVLTALGNSNSNVGGNYLEIGVQSHSIRGVGLFEKVADIEDVAVASRNNVPIYIKQLGRVSLGAKVPMGRVGMDGITDIVEGIVLMRRGEKSLPTLAKVRQRVELLNAKILPKGMRIVPYCDRTDLIDVTTHTVLHTLIEGMTLVAFILIAFLGDLRASLVVAVSIPLSLLFTFILLVLKGESANLISMGAIDFGIIVDASVVMVENIHRYLSRPHNPAGDMRVTVFRSALEVSGPVFYSTAIIVTAFLPLFTMRGVEGKIFGPMALTYGFALTGALLLAFTFSPVACSLILHDAAEEHDTWVVRLIHPIYSWLLRGFVARPWLGVTVAATWLGLTVFLVPSVGGEFMPKLEEGNLWVRATMPNTISFTEATRITDQVRQVFKKHREVTTVVSQLGRPDDGTDPTSYFNAEFFVNLTPRDTWPAGFTKDQLVGQLADELGMFAGVNFGFSQNIEDNVEEAMSGVKGENSIKLFGDELPVLESLAGRIQGVMSKIPGVADLGVFRELGQPNLVVKADRRRAARYGILSGDVNATVQAAIGGQVATQMLEGERRFDVTVRFLERHRGTVDAISNIPVATPDGGRVPLKQVADVIKAPGASFIYREDNARYIPIKFSVRGRDLQGTIAEADRKIAQAVPLPEGYHTEWAGEFQELQEAIGRLKLILPLSLAIIFFLLYSSFHNVRDALLLLFTVPLSLIGGVLALLVTHTHFSISAAVGFISLFGVTIQGGVILVSRFKQLREEGMPLERAVIEGAELRLRPVLMTALTAGIGLFPASIAAGIGSETQRPLARVVVGGIGGSAICILLVLPALYMIIHRWDRPHVR